MADTHTHDSGESHAHGDAAPGHAHTAAAPAAGETAPGGVAGRLALVALGAILMIVGAMLDWVSGGKGTEAPFSVFWSFGGDRAGFLTSAGAIVILLGLLALLGLAFRTGWLSRLAGALGLIAFVLFVITIFRAGGELDQSVGLGDIGIGMWMILVGSILVLVGGFIGTRRAAAY
ncbi:MAG TPA: sugar:proton symporter [Actinomycetota bacterium]|nr:sugar:proton symporter [Actinomycetota bacterium]